MEGVTTKILGRATLNRDTFCDFSFTQMSKSTKRPSLHVRPRTRISGFADGLNLVSSVAKAK